ncbi:MAG: DUF4242 domain-containing protein [Flavobacteriaceae bacterium]|nr:DUF4242 domain-containing protein [Flavobacteriaceae bacterium]
MPKYMDIHEMPEGVNAKHVAEMHQADLEIEHKYNCRGLTYWCDEKRKTAFCLFEAPDKKSILDLHHGAHGDVPLRIIEVNDTIVESFLGRIEDPEKSQNSDLNIINDPAFRILMVLKIEKISFKNSTTNLLKSLFDEFNVIVSKFEGSIVRQKEDNFLISFISTKNAIHAALEIEKIFTKINDASVKLSIGLSAGLPVTKNEGLFEETIKVANRLCGIANEQIVVTSEVKDLYESENLNIPINTKFIRTISYADEKFLMGLRDLIEKEWNNPALNVDDFCANLGYSQSQLYRKMTSIVNKSTNSFIKDFRLGKALQLMNKKDKNISQIAFESGFNSIAYFSKCFKNKYSVLPSIYLKNLN